MLWWARSNAGRARAFNQQHMGEIKVHQWKKVQSELIVRSHVAVKQSMHLHNNIEDAIKNPWFAMHLLFFIDSLFFFFLFFCCAVRSLFHKPLMLIFFEILPGLYEAVPNHLADESQTRQLDTPPDHPQKSMADHAPSLHPHCRWSSTGSKLDDRGSAGEGASLAILLPYSFEDGPVVYPANAFDSRLWGDKVPLGSSPTWSQKKKKRNSSGRRPAIAFLYLFLFHSLLHLTSSFFSKQNLNVDSQTALWIQ